MCWHVSLLSVYHQRRLVSAQVGGGALICQVRLFGLCYFVSFLLKPVSSDLQHQTLTTTSQTWDDASSEAESSLTVSWALSSHDTQTRGKSKERFYLEMMSATWGHLLSPLKETPLISSRLLPKLSYNLNKSKSFNSNMVSHLNKRFETFCKRLASTWASSII